MAPSNRSRYSSYFDRVSAHHILGHQEALRHMAPQANVSQKDSMFSRDPAGLSQSFLSKLYRIVPGRRKRSSSTFRLLPSRQPPSSLFIYQAHDSPFLYLLREVRDLVYHYYWTLHPHLSISRAQTMNPFFMRLYYEGRNSVDNPDTRPIYRIMPQVKAKICCPSLVLSSKQMLYEALKQYYANTWTATCHCGASALQSA
jgi:hypothetical protein